VDGCNTIEKQPLTVWEMMSDWWNDPGFNPVTEIVSDLHTDYIEEIDVGCEKVASMHKASPEYIEQRFQGMLVIMKHDIANWELSGMGDGAYDCGEDDDDDNEEDEGGYREGHEKFGLMICRNRTRLSNRHSFFEYNQTYVLYASHMLEKHSLLRSSFQMLNGKQSSGDGAGDVPSCIFDDRSEGSTNDTEGILSSTASSKKSTSKNKPVDKAKGLNNLGDSLKELSKSSERLALITAESSNVQSLRNNIESLESR
jgi:hypothetical protein